MALQIHTPHSFTNRLCLHHHHPVLAKPKFLIKSQKPTVDTDPAPEPTSSPKKPAAPGQGFGSSSSSSLTSGKSSLSSTTTTTKKKQKGKRERASIVRRSPIEKPAFVNKEEEAKAEEQRKNESAFLLAWLGLGGLILVEGIVLAASGFLPEEWDKFFVKYLYPTFTPTVVFFLAGTVAYGVLKYVQNEKLKDQK